MRRFVHSLIFILAASAVSESASFQTLDDVFSISGKPSSIFSKPWKTEYDPNNQSTAQIRPSGAREETRFDAMGRRTRFINAEGKAVNFGFDALGRLTSITNAIGDVTQYGFDAAGNIAWRRNAADELTEYGYDALNRLSSITNEGIEVATFDHDPNGNILNHRAHGDTEVSFSYDEMNRITASTQSVYSVSFVVQNQYDLNGNRTSIVYPGGLSVLYEFGADNRLESVTTKYTNDTKTISFGYDTASRLTDISYPNGINTTFGYDAESRVTNIVHGTFVDRKIERNALGFKTTECINAGIKPTVPNTFRSLKTHNAADQLTSERIQTATTNWTTIDYEYNDNGGLETVLPANETSTSYSYDYDNRISEVSGQSSEVSYLYDASGARIGRIAVDGVGDPVISTNWFVIDYADGLKRPLAETDANGNITRYYVWSNMRLLAHIDISAEGGEIHYYHSDELGSTLALTDESGNVTDQFAYMPYGYATHTGSTETPFQWLGSYGVYYDLDTDLHLTLHRAYSSKMKRFISPDPLGIDGGANVYMWANMNPLAFIDPSGLYSHWYYKHRGTVRIINTDESKSSAKVYDLSDLSKALVLNSGVISSIQLEGHFGTVGEYEYVDDNSNITQAFIDVLRPHLSDNTHLYLDQCLTKHIAKSLSWELPGTITGNDNFVRALAPFGPFADANYSSKDTSSYVNGIQK